MKQVEFTVEASEITIYIYNLKSKIHKGKFKTPKNSTQHIRSVTFKHVVRAQLGVDVCGQTPTV